MLNGETVRVILQYFIMPVWISAGVADWLCHRSSRIENTTGAKESVLHLLMLVELGIPVCAALFLQVNALVLGLLMGALIVHQATALWDLRYAVGVRFISPIEQQVHSFQEVIPLTGALLIAVLHWDQFLSVFGLGSEPPDFTFRAKEDPLPPMYVFSALAAVVSLNFLPYLEELWRCERARQFGAERSHSH